MAHQSVMVALVITHSRFADAILGIVLIGVGALLLFLRQPLESVYRAFQRVVPFGERYPLWLSSVGAPVVLIGFGVVALMSALFTA